MNLMDLFSAVNWGFVIFILGGFGLIGWGVYLISNTTDTDTPKGWALVVGGTISSFVFGPWVVDLLLIKMSVMNQYFSGFYEWTLVARFVAFYGLTIFLLYRAWVNANTSHVPTCVLQIVLAVVALLIGVNLQMRIDPVMRTAVQVAKAADKHTAGTPAATNFNAYYGGSGRMRAAIENVPIQFIGSAEAAMLRDVTMNFGDLPAGHAFSGFVPSKVMSASYYSTDGQTWTHVVVTIEGMPAVGAVAVQTTARLRQGESLNAARQAADAMAISMQAEYAIPQAVIEEFSNELALAPSGRHGTGYSPVFDGVGSP